MRTLIIVSGGDEASTIQADALLERPGWTPAEPVEGGRTWRLGEVDLWWRDGFVIREDDLDERYASATGRRPKEVIFPSRHRAESGVPSLTVHPIGVPWLDPSETAQYGGRAGDAPPPNPRLAPWFRLLRAVAEAAGLVPEFSITLETTHHGPWLRTPSLFLEIGSDESQYGRRDAAEVLARVMWQGLGLDGGPGVGDWEAAAPVEWVSEPTPVVLGLGGGHYAPRHGLLAANEGVWMGHLLANYALPFEPPTDDDAPPGGRWRESLAAALAATSRAFPGGEVWAYVDRKSFRGWQRQALLAHLADLGVPVGRTQDLVPKHGAE